MDSAHITERPDQARGYQSTVALSARLSPVASDCLPAQSVGNATTNLRRHLLRSLLRIGSLVVVDLIGFAALLGAMSLTGIDAALAALVGTPDSDSVVGWQLGAPLLAALAVTGNYSAGDLRRDPFRLSLACALAVAIPLWMVLWREPRLPTTEYILIALALATTLVVGRVLLDVAVRRVRHRGSAATRTLLVGPGAVCIEMLARTGLSVQNGFRIVGFVATDDQPRDPFAGELENLERLLDQHQVETVLLCGQVNEVSFTRVLKATIAAECQVLTISRTFEGGGVHPQIVWRNGQPFIELRAVSLRGQQLILKRLLDVIGAVSGLVLLGPVLLAVAAAVRFDSAGPVLFGQRRLGRHGRVFKCLKFRSMHIDAEQILREDPWLHEQYLKNDFKLPEDVDPRITRIGRFLRRTSLDELPQLWNVLRGDMSLVGPRPIVPEELRHYPADEPLFLSLKPGVTGAWQVQGRSDLTYPGRALLELEYVQCWSLAKDIDLLVRTIPAVLRQRGAH